MGMFLGFIYLLILLPAVSGKEGREKKLYIALSVLAVISAYFAGRFMLTDHVGASLSGMISIFMR